MPPRIGLDPQRRQARPPVRPRADIVHDAGHRPHEPPRAHRHQRERKTLRRHHGPERHLHILQRPALRRPPCAPDAVGNQVDHLRRIAQVEDVDLSLFVHCHAVTPPASSPAPGH
ncbi:Scr1 family TA system antitoxin-like transcriptional regulator [Devosia sp.]|uniref:Scr1 family TA system antitoxin-like transcriptional regulator n=1 Tax=Devosia sp. TaxID=1871048 RepID=UPI00344EE9AC